MEGQPTAKTVETQRAAVEAASENYFQVMHIPVVTGRAFSEHDDQGSEHVAIVSSRAAQEYWHSQNPVGSRIRIGAGAKDGWLRIIGVVGDVKQSWLDATPPPMIYVNYLQSPSATTAFVVRAADSASLVPAIRKVISEQDERVAIYSVTSMNQFVQDMIAGIRVAAALMAMFGAIAMILAAAGVYSMIANEVSVRKREIGIRMAMGATPSDVVRLFVVRALKLGAIGLAIGLLMAFVITRVMSNSLFGVVTLDPFTFLAFVIVLAAIAVLGAYIPARRAARVDPIIVLRYE
jgi:putative ABC transport system permease protein